MNKEQKKNRRKSDVKKRQRTRWKRWKRRTAPRTIH
jgi:hypothetical protein